MLSPTTTLTASNVSGIEPYHHITSSASSQTNSNSSSRRGSSVQQSTNVITAGCSIGSRRKSSLNFQPQLQLINVMDGGDDVGSMVACSSNTENIAAGRYSPHPNEMFLHQHHGKLSVQPIDRYDETLTCCLPPPSPAPNSDRYIIGLAPQQQSTISVPTAGNSNGTNKTSNSNSGLNVPHNLLAHSQYNSFDCNPQAIAALAQQQQPLSSSTSTSTLSTNLGDCGTSNIVNDCNGIQLTASSPTIANNVNTNLSHKYASNTVSSTMQCSISPNSRFRMSDRFRELPPPGKSVTVDSQSFAAQPSSSTRFVSSTHFLTQSTPLVSSDTYGYLSSTVHTPVKRYVPTPPSPNELYTEINTAAIPPPIAPASATLSTTVAAVTSNAATGSNGAVNSATPQHVNTLPYRFRMKCCSNEQNVKQIQQQQQQPLPKNTSHMPQSHLEHRSLSVTDYYTTSPRIRSLYNGNNSNSKCNAAAASITLNCSNGRDSPIVILHDQHIQLGTAAAVKLNNSSGASTASSCISSGSSSVSSASSSASPITVGSSTGSGSVFGGNGRQPAPPSSASRTSTTACMLNDYVSRTPSIEYINSSVAASTGRSSGASVGGGGRIITSAVTMDANSYSAVTNGSNSGPTNSNTSNAATCLHCNTVRRTTGVHQTTQTTGPISPIPFPQLNSGTAHCWNSIQGATHDQTSLTLTPSTSESHISPLSPTANTTQQQHTARLLQSEMDSIDSKHDKSTNNEQQQLYLQQQQKMLRNVTSQNMLPSAEHSSNSCNQQLQSIGNRPLSLQHTPLQSQHQQQQLTMQQHYSRKKRINQYLRKEIACFFGVEENSEAQEYAIWHGRQRRLALRRFGALKPGSEWHTDMYSAYNNDNSSRMHLNGGCGDNGQHYNHHHHTSERPDILPAQDAENDDISGGRIRISGRKNYFDNVDFQLGDHVERKASVATMIISSLAYIVHTLNKRQPRYYRQWSRSFAPAHVHNGNDIDNPSDFCDSLTSLQEDEVFFDSPGTEHSNTSNNGGNMLSVTSGSSISPATGTTSTLLRLGTNAAVGGSKILEHQRQIYMGERVHGWRTSAIHSTQFHNSVQDPTISMQQQSGQHTIESNNLHQHSLPQQQSSLQNSGTRGNRISAQLLDGVLENSRRSFGRRIKLFSVNDLDDRTDHRPFFTYWINTVQILVLFLSLVCYDIGPIGIGVEQRTGQVLVPSLSLQTVQHTEQRNVWIGPRNNDLVHMGAKFASCMRRDVKIMDVLLKTRRQERETACCIRNDDSGCVQSSQADCSVRGLFPTKSISTWKKWSPGESGPGGRISGSVCGLDPKFCDAPASIAPYEWPDDITKWPICRKTNSFSHRFRYKDHTAEHMVCEVIGHPCCTGVYGECRITTREYCDFVNGYFHEEASLCSQISCLNNVCGMFPFFSIEVPDQLYRLFTSLCLHAGIMHLTITVAFQHVFLADLEKLIGPIRTAIVYIGSGLAGNLTSAVLVPYKPEVGPLASLSGVVASLAVLLILIHWKQLRKPHIALFKLIFIGAILFGIGILPWQLNFAGLLAGIFCGIFLTIALVPFVSINKYGRKGKINLIWSCIISHLLIYSVMLVVFYVFPTELTNLNFGEILSNSLSPNVASNNVGNISGGGNGNGGSDVMSSISKNNYNHSSVQQQFYYHHHSDDIITNSVLSLTSKIAVSKVVN